MAAIYRLKGLGWLSGCAVVAIGFYLVSSQVAAERKRLDQVDRRIVGAERDIRALETEFDVRANLAQLERWNGNTLALTTRQFIGFVRHAGTQSNLFQYFGCAFQAVGFAISGINQREHHIIQSSGAGQQVKGLEYKTDFFITDFGQRIVKHLGNRDSIQYIFSGTGCIQATQYIHQR